MKRKESHFIITIIVIFDNIVLFVLFFDFKLFFKFINFYSVIYKAGTIDDSKKIILILLMQIFEFFWRINWQKKKHVRVEYDLCYDYFSMGKWYNSSSALNRIFQKETYDVVIINDVQFMSVCSVHTIW